MSSATNDVEALLDLLATERRLILDGRYSDLESLQAQKARLAVRPGVAPPNAVARLRDLAAANLALLAAARDGLSAAQARLRELERLARGASVYDQHGARVDGVADPRTMRRV